MKENNYKPQIPDVMEAIFDAAYLIFDLIAAMLFFIFSQGKTLFILYGILTLTLCGGDAFHLVPRIIRAVRGSNDKIKRQLGIGLQVSSITMTVFYIMLMYIWKLTFPELKMPVIIDNGFGGVIFHEACGHALEASSVSKNQSVFCNKLGQKVASDKVTAIDDGTIPNAWGSQNVDDEGNPQQKRVLIENGILKSYMIDRLNGRRMGLESTSSSRRQSYKFETTSRMTNTYIAAGNDDFDEMFEGIKRGLYAKKMGGGSVNPQTGEFNFAVLEGYLIEDGKISYPVKGASLIGNGADILFNIDRVGKNLERGQGMCGASSGSIPTDVGQPAIRVSQITVGGTANE